MTDRTNYLQSLMHMIKGNLGTGILAMPATFAHCGLIGTSIGLPVLTLVAMYCVHLLVRSSQHLENKMKWMNLDYAELAKGAFKTGPDWMRPFSGAMCRLVDGILIISQGGICCVYIVFIMDNIRTILLTYKIEVSANYIFLAMIPIALALSYVRTLKRLAIASACANVLQVVGLSIIIEFLVRELPAEPEIKLFKPPSEVALGFGTMMFAFEGIAVVLPIYSRMKRPEQMGGVFGAINVSYILLLCLYSIIGVLGYLRFGELAQGSITLNLPKEPLYDCVRAIFTVSLFLSYPLQFYVIQEITWNWIKSKFTMDGTKPATQNEYIGFEYLNRTVLVLVTFILAIIVPRLNLMMDFVGSISGTSLSITLPAIIHMTALWEDTSGSSKVFMMVVDLTLVLFGIFASANGSYFSLLGILQSFNGLTDHSHHINS